MKRTNPFGSGRVRRRLSGVGRRGLAAMEAKPAVPEWQGDDATVTMSKIYSD
jgi:hypothetical protein